MSIMLAEIWLSQTSLSNRDLQRQRNCNKTEINDPFDCKPRNKRIHFEWIMRWRSYSADRRWKWHDSISVLFIFNQVLGMLSYPKDPFRARKINKQFLMSAFCAYDDDTHQSRQKKGMALKKRKAIGKHNKRSDENIKIQKVKELAVVVISSRPVPVVEWQVSVFFLFFFLFISSSFPCQTREIC